LTDQEFETSKWALPQTMK